MQLVTGATGFVGAALVERLLARGDHVRALVRRTSDVSALDPARVELVRGDLTDGAAVAAAIDGCAVVYHVAGAVKARTAGELVRANADGTRNVAVACAAARRRPLLVYVSSLAAAGPAVDGRARTEDDPPAPVSRYGESKLAGEEAIRALCDTIDASIVRPPIVYGPRDRELMPQLLRMARLGLVVRVGPQKRYSVIHVADLCDALLAVAERGRRVRAGSSEGIYFVDDGAEHTWDEIALAACAAAGRRARVLVLPEATSALVAVGATVLSALTRAPSMLSFDKVREVRQPAWTCTSRRAARELDWAAKLSLSEGMRDAVAAFR